MEFLAESDQVELVQDRRVEALADAVDPRRARLGACEIDVVHGRVQLVVVPLDLADDRNRLRRLDETHGVVKRADRSLTSTAALPSAAVPNIFPAVGFLACN